MRTRNPNSIMLTYKTHKGRLVASTMKELGFLDSEPTLIKRECAGIITVVLPIFFLSILELRKMKD